MGIRPFKFYNIQGLWADPWKAEMDDGTLSWRSQEDKASSMCVNIKYLQTDDMWIVWRAR